MRVYLDRRGRQLSLKIEGKKRTEHGVISDNITLITQRTRLYLQPTQALYSFPRRLLCRRTEGRWALRSISTVHLDASKGRKTQTLFSDMVWLVARVSDQTRQIASNYSQNGVHTHMYITTLVTTKCKTQTNFRVTHNLSHTAWHHKNVTTTQINGKHCGKYQVSPELVTNIGC